MQRSSVVLPEPDGPSTQSTSPFGTSSVIPLSTSTRPKRLCTASVRTIGGSARCAHRPDPDPPAPGIGTLACLTEKRLWRRRCSGVGGSPRDEPRPKWRST